MQKTILIVRNILFNTLFFLCSLFWSIALIWALLLPPAAMFRIIQRTYLTHVAWLEKNVLALEYKVEGLENLPKSGGYVLAAKHQSAYETLKIPLLVNNIGIIMKRELTWIPIWGWYPRFLKMICIDRSSAKGALTSILDGAQRIINEENRPLLIFPQGTRTIVGETRPYKIGIGRIYEKVNAPVVPVALNSGLYWGKNKFWKKSGVVTIKFLPAIQPGLKLDQFMKVLEHTIETESDRLLPVQEHSKSLKKTSKKQVKSV